MIGPEVPGFSRLSWLRAAHALAAEHNFTASECLVMLDIFNLAPSDGRGVSISAVDLAGRSSVSVKSVERATRRMVSLGLIVRRVRGGRSLCRGCPSVYDLGTIE